MRGAGEDGKGYPVARTPVWAGLADVRGFLCDITVAGRELSALHSALPPEGWGPLWGTYQGPGCRLRNRFLFPFV